MEAMQAAERLENYFERVGAVGEGRDDIEPVYPEDFDPAEDARLVREALAER